MTEHAIDPASAIEAAAHRLRDAEMTGAQCEPVSRLLPEQDIGAAYAVQQLNVERRIARGRRLIGRKIGLTSVAVQRQLGVSQPDYGALLSDMIVGDGATLPPEGLLQPKAEAEVALVLGSDLDVDEPHVADILRAVAFVLPAIEIVDSRIRDWKISLVDTIADNASSARFVLGTPAIRADGFDFAGCAMEMTINDAPASRGDGRACMGSPLNAAVWLARRMRQLGTPLRAGDIVMTGALGPMCAIRPGDRVMARIAGLGTVGFELGGAGS